MINPDDSGAVDITPRRRCYHEVRHTVTAFVADYYKKNPQKLREPDAEQNLDQLISLMLKILKVLDKYEISDLPKVDP